MGGELKGCNIIYCTDRSAMITADIAIGIFHSSQEKGDGPCQRQDHQGYSCNRDSRVQYNFARRPLIHRVLIVNIFQPEPAGPTVF